MPEGPSTITADTANEALAGAVRRRLADSAAQSLDVLIVSGVPQRNAGHIVVSGPLSTELDEWDRAVEPQTVSGALWLPESQPAPEDAVVAWLLLRLPTPTTPLSDLTDANDRALRWSIIGASAVRFPQASSTEVDEQSIRAWADEQAEVRKLGESVDRIGGVTAEEVLQSVERFRAALSGLDGLAELPTLGATPELDAAVAEQLRQVQKGGLAKWRAGKARAQAQADLSATAKSLAGDRLAAVIEARRASLVETANRDADRDRMVAVAELLAASAAEVDLPTSIDFDNVPRSWSGQAPAPRRYVLVNDEQAESLGEIPGATIRGLEQVPPDTALCAVLQAGFSLPGIA